MSKKKNEDQGSKEESKPSALSSFKDLRLRFGGESEDPEPGAEKQDTTTDDLVDDEGDDGSTIDPAGPARTIMFSLPDGFAPMETGPRWYREIDSEEMELLASFRIRTVFLPEVLAEVAQLPENPAPEDYEGVTWRRDLRSRRIFTIDGADARDFDDAICIQKLDDGGYEMSVHIADVSHYVRPGTALNAEAMTRATSVYVADQVIPMLPEKLSNHLCSLNPDRERLAFSVFIYYDAKGRRTDYEITKSVIRSMRRCTYKAVQELLDGVDNPDTRRLEDLKPDLELFAEWTRLQQAARDRRGSLRMQSGELKFKFDANDEVESLYTSPTYFSQALIEETALAANQAVGDFFKRNGLPTIYRIHPEKDAEEIAEVSEMLEKYGVRVPKKDRLSGRDIGEMIRFARRQKNAEALIGRIMGLVERATYEVRGDEDRAEHFGLAMEHYLHFTSPIRRYPDLIVHRMLFELLQRGESARLDMSAMSYLTDLLDIAAHSSMQSDVADMAETAIADLKVCQYMEPKIGRKFRASVNRVSRGGMDILLNDELVGGFLPARSIGNQVTQEGPKLTIRTRQGVRVFHEGDTIEVVVAAVDFVRLKVLFELAPRVR